MAGENGRSPDPDPLMRRSETLYLEAVRLLLQLEEHQASLRKTLDEDENGPA